MAQIVELTLSIVICTKDREQSLRNCLDTIFRQTRQPDEIVIVDDGDLNREAIVALVEAHGIACHYLKKDTPGLTASRNLSIAHARGDVLLFLDDDVLLDLAYIAGMMEIYEADPQRQVGGVTGTQRIRYRAGILPFLRLFGLDGRQPGAILPSGYGVLVREGELDRPTAVQWLPGCNMSYRREVFGTFRFDQALGTYGWGEDRDFSFRVSRAYTLMATPKATLVHVRDAAGRINTRRFGFMETYNLYRFFSKNMPKRMANWLALGWAMLGIVTKDILLLLISPHRRAMLAQLLGSLEGLWAIATGKEPAA